MDERSRKEFDRQAGNLLNELVLFVIVISMGIIGTTVLMCAVH